MGKHIEKLVLRYFRSLVNPKQLLGISILQKERCQTPTNIVRLHGGLVVEIDEADRRSLKTRMRYVGDRSVLTIRQPQELLKKETLKWLKKATGNELRPETLPHSLLQKIKHYRADYRRPSRRYKMRRAIRKSKRLQKDEKRFQELRLRMRQAVKSN